MSGKERPKWPKFALLKRRKRKEVKEDPNSVAYGRFQWLEANGRFQCLLVFGRFPCLVALKWFQCLVVLKGEGETSFSPLFTSSPNNFTWTFFFPLILRLYFTMVLNCYLMPFFLFPWPINYNHASWCTKSSTHSSSSWFWLKIFFPFLEFTTSCMITFYELQVAWVNEKPPPESSLDLTFAHHPCDEDPEPWKVCSHLKVEPPRIWYYCIFLNSHTLVILLQIDPAFGDEPKIVCEGCYKTKDTFIFTWSSISSVGHYRWLRNPIHQLPSNSKMDYLVCTIWCILNFLQSWTITMT